jgi:acyl carrier protein
LSPDETPRGDVEQRLSRIWAEMLGIERIGANDDFFELGGHSLMATRVLSRVADDLGVRLVLRDVFEAPTIRRLAARIVEAGVAGSRGSTATSEPPNGPAGEREELEF